MRIPKTTPAIRNGEHLFHTTLRPFTPRIINHDYAPPSRPSSLSLPSPPNLPPSAVTTDIASVLDCVAGGKEKRAGERTSEGPIRMGGDENVLTLETNR